MPIQSIKLTATVKTKLNRKISQLITKGILHTPKNKGPYLIGFCMHVQVVPKKEFDSLAFGKPEGIRVFIQSGEKIIAAADFIYVGKTMKLSYLHQGNGLQELLLSLNKLEKKYAGTKEIYHVELISFLLSCGPYILIRSGDKKQFYHSKGKRLLEISAEGLKKQINKILINRIK